MRNTLTFFILASNINIKYPCIVKPINSGSSFGVSKVNNKSKLNGAIKLAKKYATNYIIEEFIDGFELQFIAHTPQNGSGVIICKAINVSTIYHLLKMWRENYSISFDIKPALTNEELNYLQISEDHWDNN